MAAEDGGLIDRLLAIKDLEEQRRFLGDHADQVDRDLVLQLKSRADHALRDDTPKALEVAESALLASELLDEPLSFALSLRAKAQALHLLGRLEDSLEFYDRASDLYLSQDNEIEGTRTLIGKVDALVHLSRYDDALETAQRCRDVFSSHGERLLEAKVTMNQGNIYHRLDRNPEALEMYQAARDIFLGEDDPLLIALADTNLGNSYSNIGQFSQALQSYRRASSVYREQGLKAGLAMNESNLGYLYFLRGEYNEALARLTSARRTFDEMDVRRNVATVDLDSAEVYVALNMPDRAIAAYDSALGIFKALGFASEAARGLLGKAIVHVQAAETAAAEQELDEVRAYFEDEKNQTYLGIVDLHQAILMHRAQAHDDALELAEKARDRFVDTNLLAKTAYSHLVIGEILRDMGRDSEAEEQFTDALLAGQSTRLPWLLYESHAALGRITRQSRPAQARQHYASAIEAVERTRMSLRPEELKAAFVGDKLDVYSEMISLCLEEGSDESLGDAFAYVERSKSQALLDLLAGQVRLGSEAEADVDPRLAEKLWSLREELNSYYNVIDQYEVREGPRARAIIQGMRERIVEMEEEFNTLVGELQLESGNAASLHRPISVRPAQLDDLVQEDVTLIEYFAIEDDIGAFVMVSGEPIRWFPNLTRTSTIAGLLRRLQFQLEKVSYGEEYMAGLEDQLMMASLAYLGQLYDQLLAPMASHFKRRIIIIPHGLLHNVPFHALHDGDKYVIDEHEVAYAPSASVLKFCWDKDTAPINRPLALGVGDETIPLATQEAMSVASLFPESTLLVEGAATQEQLQALVETHDVLHLASHAVFSQDNRSFSRIKLEDGWLTLHDIYNLNLRNTGLVTLSACETGLSSVNAGDELVGLTRGFFSAGTPSLVVSLWKVNDEVTTRLMYDFYEGLRSGQTKGAALREALLRAKEAKPHPYYWAPFILMGKST